MIISVDELTIKVMSLSGEARALLGENENRLQQS